MYYDHFGLNQAPFKITPDTRLFFDGGRRGDVLDALVYAIGSGEGIVKVVGEVGSGKTMLCRMLELRLPSKVEVVYLANPSLSPDDIHHAIALELGLDVSPGANRLHVMHAIQQRLLEKHAEGRQVVVFIEEAQGMPIETLEEIRLLSNLETAQDKLLQIVLFGQPELEKNLKPTHIRQLKDRITNSFVLPPLTAVEIGQYVDFRLRSVGYRGPEIFTRAAYRRIAHASRGLIRRVNILADKALLAAFAQGAHSVGRRQVRAAINDSEFGEAQRWSPARATALAAVSVLLVVAVVWAAMGPPLDSWGPWSSAVPGTDEAAQAGPGTAVAAEPPVLSQAADVVSGAVAAPRTEQAAAADSPTPSQPEASPMGSSSPQHAQTAASPAPKVEDEPSELPPRLRLARTLPASDRVSAASTSSAEKPAGGAVSDEKDQPSSAPGSDEQTDNKAASQMRDTEPEGKGPAQTSEGSDPAVTATDTPASESRAETVTPGAAMVDVSSSEPSASISDVVAEPLAQSATTAAAPQDVETVDSPAAGMAEPKAAETAVPAAGGVADQPAEDSVTPTTAGEAGPQVVETAAAIADEEVDAQIAETALPAAAGAVESNAAEAAAATAVQAKDPQDSETAEPIVAEAADEQVVETATPTIAEAADGQVVEALTPTVAEAADGQVVETITPIVAEAADGQVADTPTPAVAEAADGQVAETVTPIVAEAADGQDADTPTPPVLDVADSQAVEMAAPPAAGIADTQAVETAAPTVAEATDPPELQTVAPTAAGPTVPEAVEAAAPLAADVPEVEPDEAPTPVEVPKLIAARLQATEAWLSRADPSHYSIQLLLTQSSRPGNLEAFLGRLRRRDLLDDVYVYETTIAGRSWYAVLYGEYPRVRAAREALSGLPAEVKRDAPFIRNVRDVPGVG